MKKQSIIIFLILFLISTQLGSCVFADINFEMTENKESLENSSYEIFDEEQLHSAIMSFDISDNGTFAVEFTDGDINIYDKDFKFLRCIHTNYTNSTSYIFWNDTYLMLYSIKSKTCKKVDLDGNIVAAYDTIYSQKSYNMELELINKYEQNYENANYILKKKAIPIGNTYLKLIKQQNNESDVVLIDVSKYVRTKQIIITIMICFVGLIILYGVMKNVKILKSKTKNN